MQNYFSIALFNFLIASILGVIMRYAFVGDIAPLQYRHLMHAHSHLAMMGWIFMALMLLIVNFWIPGGFVHNRYFRLLFWSNQVVVVLMTVSFIVQGYDSISILFSSLHLLLSYLFAWMMWPVIDSYYPSGKLMKAALIWLVLSSLGLWLLPFIIVTLGRNSEYYFMSVQYFLHFQFNGWFTFAVLALIFKSYQQVDFHADKVSFKRFYYALATSCVFTYALAVTWSNPDDLLFLLNSLGVLFQLAALYFLINLLRNQIFDVRIQTGLIAKVALSVAMISLILKVLIQAAVVLPFVAVISYTIRQFVIGFIHLTLLGAVTGAIIAVSVRHRIISVNAHSSVVGLTVLLLGIITTEILLFVQGLQLWRQLGYLRFYYEGIFLLSLLMPLGILMILAGQFRYTAVETHGHIISNTNVSPNQIFKSPHKKFVV
ncbi:MAG: hypothetical protein IPM26_05855 [Saprospiraceae bacterium]|nr:hypothetical protein [Saprospiraceae bacterium]